MGPRSQRTHLAVAHEEQALAPEAAQDPVDDRHIQRIIGLLPRGHIKSQRQTEGIEGGHHGLDLPQRRIILAVTELPQAVLPSFMIA